MASVREDVTRVAKGLTWLEVDENGDLVLDQDGNPVNPLKGETATIVAENSLTHDRHNKAPIPNTGYGAVFYPKGADGESNIEVTDELGGSVTGVVTY